MSSIDPLVERLAAEAAAATERIRSLQTEAARVFLGQEQRFMRFVALTERIHAILQPRLEAFTKLNVFKDIEQTVSLELRGPEERGFHGRTTTLVDLLQRKPTDTMQGMSVVYCAFGREEGAGFLGLLVSDRVCRFNGRMCQIVYVPTSPVPMSGAVVFAAADSVHRVDMPVDDLMKICLSIGVMSSKVIPEQYVVLPEEVHRARDGVNDSQASKVTVHAKSAAAGAVESSPQ